MKYINLKALLACMMAVSLVGCGGKIEATIGGTVSGLSGNTTVVLQNNGGDNLSVGNNGSFTFAKQIEAGDTYDVTVLTNPPGETCYVENAYGTVEQSVGNVESVAVICNANVTASNELTGTATGLTSGQSVQLTIGGTNTVTITGNSTGSQQIFVFPNPLSPNTTVTVNIASPSTGVSCQVGILSTTGTTTYSSSVSVTVPSTGTPPQISLSCN
jgi:hypothetical protein